MANKKSSTTSLADFFEACIPAERLTEAAENQKSNLQDFVGELRKNDDAPPGTFPGWEKLTQYKP